MCVGVGIIGCIEIPLIVAENVGKLIKHFGLEPLIIFSQIITNQATNQ
jgi:hypothetical protein